MRARLQILSTGLRPGAMLALVVVAAVGLVGLVRLDSRLMLISLASGIIILALSAVIVAVRTWHRGNTLPEANYLSAEDMIRMQRMRSNRKTS